MEEVIGQGRLDRLATQIQETGTAVDYPLLLLAAARRVAVDTFRLTEAGGGTYQLDMIPLELDRKAKAYDDARATVKIEGGTRAYYVLRAENAEQQVRELTARVAQLANDLEEAVNRGG